MTKMTALEIEAMTPENRDQFFKSALTEALDKFRSGQASAAEVTYMIDAYINIRLGETLKLINESLEKTLVVIKRERDVDDEPRKTMQ